MTAANVMRFALALALSGALTPAADGTSSAPARIGAEGGGTIAQFCLPPEDRPDTYRIFCRKEAAAKAADVA